MGVRTPTSIFLFATFWFSNTTLFSCAQIEDKRGRICSVSGGMDATRLLSRRIRSIFRGSIEDVEFIREYIAESMYNDGIVGGMHDLDKILYTLDWKARNLTKYTSTIKAGFAWTDDRPYRRMERYIGLANDPLIGNKSTDIAMADTVSNIFPWIVDRKSIETSWWLDHQNGRSEGPHKQQLPFDQLYVTAWLGTFGEAWMYYPPLTTVFGHPFVFSEVVGDAYNSHENDNVQPNLPRFNPDRKSTFTKPYIDKEQPDLLLITAMAPIYYTGKWQGHTYDNTYVASTGVDINLSAVSTLLDEVDGTLASGSFAFLVDKDFNIVVISQATVERIYPERTGMEESRVTFDSKNSSIIAFDRRNQAYLASDTTLQSPLNLTNADWNGLHSDILSLSRGDRGYFSVEIVLTGDANATSFYAMCERWPSVVDWILVTLVPAVETDNAMNPRFTEPGVNLEVIAGNTVEGEAVFKNDGILELAFTTDSFLCDPWFQLETHIDEPQVLEAGDNITLKFHVNSETLLDVGTATSCKLNVNVKDDDQYPDCFYDRVITFDVNVKVEQEPELNQLGDRKYIRLFVVWAGSCGTSLGFLIWVQLKRRTRIVRASQASFLRMVCVGTMFMGMSAIPLVVDDRVASTRVCDIACMAFPWLFCIGFCISFSALFAKIWRINKIFHASNTFRRMKVKDKDAMIPFVIMFTVNVTLMLIWTRMAPLRWKRVWINENSSYGTCYSSLEPMAQALLLAITLFNFAAVLLANRQAFQARTIVDEFYESTYIFFAMASVLQVFLVAVPILFLTNENPRAFFYTITSIVLIVALSLLLFIFVPKIHYLRKNKDGMKVSRNASVTSSFMRRNNRVEEEGSVSSSRDAEGLRMMNVQQPAPNAADAKRCKKKLKRKLARVQRLKSKLADEEGLDVKSIFLEFDMVVTYNNELLSGDT